MSKPNIFNIPAGEPFADAVVRGVLDRYVDQILDISEVTILLPTRRALKTLRDAFLRATDGDVAILPRLRSIGDVDEHGLMLQGWSVEAQDDTYISPPIASMERLLILSRLIRSFPRPKSQAFDEAESIRLARYLAAFLDAMQAEDLDAGNLHQLVMGEYAQHWTDILKFLSIVIDVWPKIKQEKGLLDPIEYSNALLKKQACLWQEHPCSTPVIAAGIMAGRASVVNLLHVILSLPQGAIVLPGFDKSLSDQQWQEISKTRAASHPQAEIARLLQALKIERTSIQEWTQPSAPLREGLWSEVMRPSANSSEWVALNTHPLSGHVVQGMSLIEAETEREEALIIALAIRQAIEKEGQTVMVVTPDRKLIKRVRGELMRWNIVVDDSAGTPLSAIVHGAFLRLSAQMVSQDWAPIALLACLKHPFVSLGWERVRYLKALRAFEKTILRGPRIQGGAQGMLTYIRSVITDIRDDRRQLVERLFKLAHPFAGLIKQKDVSLSVLIQAHGAFCEALAATDTETGAKTIWTKEAGKVAADFIIDVTNNAHSFGHISGYQYPVILESLMVNVVVRENFGLHPRIAILGLIEARGMQGDVVILSGLNEGVWPPDSGADPWMSRPMREDFGLPSFDYKIGAAAHDFVQLASYQNVIITRSKKESGAPSVPSRWLLRLSAVLQSSHLTLENTQSQRLLSWAQALDTHLPKQSMSCPAPRPPLCARPRVFSITQVGLLMRDPYALYARKVLKLSALAPVDEPLGFGERGSFIHEALEKFVQEYEGIPPEMRYKRLLEIGQEVLKSEWNRDTIWAFWWPRFCRAAEWFISAEEERRHKAAPAWIEKMAEMPFQMPYGEVIIKAKPDRIDRTKDGGAIIMDYKTGVVPREDAVTLGLEPQLPLEGVMLRHGVFGDFKDVAHLVYISIAGKSDSPDKIKILKNHEALIEAAEEGVRGVFAEFGREETPFLSHPDALKGKADPDFVHLARIAEWRTNMGNES